MGNNLAHIVLKICREEHKNFKTKGYFCKLRQYCFYEIINTE